MNDLHLAPGGIFLLLVILLSLHRPLCTGVQGFGVGLVKSVPVLLTCLVSARILGLAYMQTKVGVCLQPITLLCAPRWLNELKF